ncbi:MAG: PQQ-dependent sugar dehydrogenase [Thermoanaerobaculia bacterium]
MRKLASFSGLVLLVAAFALVSRASRGASASAARPENRALAPAVELEPLADSLTSITGIAHADDGRLFLTLQRGRILVWDGTQVLPTPFLDVSSLIICCGEQGLLSTAFHPLYPHNGFFFINYTDLNGDTVVARYHVTADPNVADPFSAAVLLNIDQPFPNHNGGQLQFGLDGFLYVGMGDGGSSNDPSCNAQSNSTLLGKMLRIDVDQNVDTAPFYGIPPDNPFLSTGGPPEAWAKGLRNPWRFSFDRVTGDLLIGDVGQGQREEIDFQPADSPGGENYGWKAMEGTLCGDGGTTACPAGTPPCGDPAYTLPILEYSHGSGECSVTGGYLYRGAYIPDLYGRYVYGDFCSGRIWAGTRQGAAWTAELMPITAPNLTTFGEDVDGELYVGTETGALFKVRASLPPTPTIDTISPTSSLARGQTIVTITGTNFTGDTQVFFGSTPAVVTVLNPTTLTALAPTHTPGIVDIVVSNPGAPAATRPGAFAYVAIQRVPPHPAPRVVDR